MSRRCHIFIDNIMGRDAPALLHVCGTLAVDEEILNNI